MDLTSPIPYVDKRLCLVDPFRIHPAFATFLHRVSYGKPIILEACPTLGIHVVPLLCLNVDLSGFFSSCHQMSHEYPIESHYHNDCIYLSIYLPIYLSIYLSIYVYVYYNVYICVLYTLRWPFWDGMPIAIAHGLSYRARTSMDVGHGHYGYSKHQYWWKNNYPVVLVIPLDQVRPMA